MTMFNCSLILWCLLLNFVIVFGAGPDEWRSRSIYFLLTDRFNGAGACADLSNYCGGTFDGIQQQLGYIQRLGFDAIWITPVIQNTAGGYHGYWAKDLYEINENYGSVGDLKELVSAAHERDMYVMVDVVANHMGYFPTEEEDYSIFPQFQKEDFHNCQVCNQGCGPSDWDDKIQVEQCRLAGLPDLNQSKENVKTILNEWIKWLVTEFDFDGIRIDTVKHVPLDFWKGFTDAAGVFSTGEIFSGDSNFLGQYKDSMDSLLSFPMYYTLNDIFSSQQSMYLIPQRLDEYEATFRSQVDVLGTFMDNHDVPRFLNNQPDQSLFMNALAYVVLGRGIPVVYYGTELGFSGGQDPQNREILWTNGFDLSSAKYSKFLSTLNHVRQFFKLWDEQQSTVTIQDDCYAFSRGPNVIVALTNTQADSFSCPIAPQNDMCDVMDSNYKLDENNGEVQFIDRQPRILVNCDQLEEFVAFFEQKFDGSIYSNTSSILEGEMPVEETTEQINNTATEQIKDVDSNSDDSNSGDSNILSDILNFVTGASDPQTSPKESEPIKIQEKNSKNNSNNVQVISEQAQQWKSRQIYQLLTDRFAPSSEQDENQGCADLSDYCGGTFEGITRRLDYIQSLGFDAIWISPIVKNTEKGYHGYWAQNFSLINPMFGDEESLQMMIDEAHEREMLVMLDVVANHVGFGPSGANFLNVFYPPFQAGAFHDCERCDGECSISDWDDAYQLVNCRVAGLPDLNQTEPAVRKFLLDWVSDTVTKYNFDAIRIDTVKHVERDFWTEYSQAAGVFSIGEVFTFDEQFLQSYQGTMDSLLSYPMSGILRGVFGEQQGMQLLQQTRKSMISFGFELSVLGLFLENHDLPRFLSYQPDTSLYINALAYVLLSEGIPILYYGAEQGFSGANDPDNREPLWISDFDTTTDLFTTIQKLTNIRSEQKLWSKGMVEVAVDDTCYVFARGSTLVVLTNAGSDNPQTTCTIDVSSYAQFKNQKQFCGLVYDQQITINGGVVEVLLRNGMPQVLQVCNVEIN
eukprot:TRINITY_DN1053_c0_g1_i6.p1 TRINITY_DN1053_c0_g1~~TRINITY_DN1053_c0_g1_i6.p1  ORF type:complete len:1057 (-),score=168.34 TRINITY_DN1053_c0_g1_i6:183-3257(-)